MVNTKVLNINNIYITFIICNCFYYLRDYNDYIFYYQEKNMCLTLFVSDGWVLCFGCFWLIVWLCNVITEGSGSGIGRSDWSVSTPEESCATGKKRVSGRTARTGRRSGTTRTSNINLHSIYLQNVISKRALWCQKESDNLINDCHSLRFISFSTSWARRMNSCAWWRAPARRARPTPAAPRRSVTPSLQVQLSPSASWRRCRPNCRRWRRRTSL